MRTLRICLSLCLLLTSLLANAERIVVIGDLHADINAARSAFQMAGAIDGNDNWIGGDLVIVQMGDIIGRSYEERETLDFVLMLGDQAQKAGGSLHVLIGNHELFGPRLELRWVHDDAYAAFDSLPDLDLDDPRLADVPAPKRARMAALAPGGYYASKLAEFPVVLRLGDTIYVHGGITPYWAEYGIDRINRDIQEWFAGISEEPAWVHGRDLGNDDDNAVMSRHFSGGIEGKGHHCAMLDEALAILGAERMIVAHEVRDSISSFCTGKVWAVDVGMSREYNSHVQVLEIIDDENFTVIGQ
jgi:hypothetical protein